MNDDSLKNFRESYVFHCLVIKVLCLSTAHLFYHCHFRLSRTFLSFFKLFKWLFAIRRCISNSFTLSHSFLNVKHFFEVFYFFKKKSKTSNGEGGIWTLAPVTRPIPLAGAPLRPLEYFSWLRIHNLLCNLKCVFSKRMVNYT